MGVDSHRTRAHRHRSGTVGGRAVAAGCRFADAPWPVTPVADAARCRADHEPLSRAGLATLRARCHRVGARLVDVAMSEDDRLTLVLRYADVGIATYASLRIVGQPSRTVTWVVEEPILLAALDELTEAIPEPHGAESRRDAIERALATGPFAAPETELTVAYILGVLLIATAGWQLLA